MTDFYLILSGIMGTVATGFTGWFFGRKKTAAEVVSTEIDNDIKLSGHYRIMLDDLEKRYIDQFTKFKTTTDKQMELYEEQIKFLEKKVRILQQENKELRTELKKLKLEHQNLVSAYGNSTK
jgi:predicted RNase H-like nuclease (RuvC/YqgF family)